MYATAGTVRAVLARDTTAPIGTAAELSDADITAAITSAQAQVDGRLAVRYSVPFTDPVPQLVADITRDIAAYLSDLTYRQGKDYESQMDPVVLRYQQALSLLGQIAGGQIDLPVSPGTAETGGLLTAHNRYDGNLFGLSDFGLGVRNSGGDVW